MSQKAFQLQKDARGLRIGARNKSAAHEKARIDGDFLHKIKSGDIAALARAISLMAGRGSCGSTPRNAILAGCRQASQDAWRIAVTGGMGTGKSRLIEQLGLHLVKKELRRPCVLTLDSSSARSGGCLLGNKGFMRELMQCEQVFIRPLASGTSAAACTAMLDDVMTLCAAAPFDAILLEAGDTSPARSSLASLTDCLISVIPAGSDGDLAAMRSSIGQDADIHVITWPSGTRRDKALITMRTLAETLELFQGDASRAKPRVTTVTFEDDAAICDLWRLVDGFCTEQQHSGKWQARRAAARRHLLHQHLCDRLEEDFFADAARAKAYEDSMEPLASSSATMNTLVEQLLALYRADNTPILQPLNPPKPLVNTE